MSNNLLKGKRGIIFGALNEMSIAWKVAERAVEEGAVITLTNTPVAVRMGQVSELGEKLNAEIIPAMLPMLKISKWYLPNQWKFWEERSILFYIRSVCRPMFGKNVLMMILIMIF